MHFHQLQSQPRHMRYIFFVDAAISYSALADIMKQNLNHWGGAYNPIVPVKDGKIADGYLALIQHFDPDMIYHADTVDPQIIKDLGWFNPSEYIKLGEIPVRASIAGVSRMHLLSLIEKRPVIYANNLWKTDSVLLDYYELNFGIRPMTYVGEDRAIAGYQVLTVTPDNFGDLHAKIYTHKPINFAELSNFYPCTKLMRSFQHMHYSTELVISAGNGDSRDLLYWWNRNLYEGGRLFFVTSQQLSALVTDEHFGRVLSARSDLPGIDVVSLSISRQEVEELINTSLKLLRSGSFFSYRPISTFPFPVDGVQDATDYIKRDPGKQQSLLAGETKFSVAVPVFIKDGLSANDAWAVDMQLTSTADDGKVKEMLLPKTTNTAYLLRRPGRVNLNRRLTYYYDSNTPHIPATEELIKIPTFSGILPQLITAPVLDGVVCQSSYTHTSVGEPGRRLLSFMRLSGGDLSILQQYLSDKFWFDLFIDCCESQKLVGDALSFKQLQGKCLRHFTKDGYKFKDEAERHKLLKSLAVRLKPYVAELVAMKVLLQGFTLSCRHCSHQAWYALEEVATSVKCSGCQEYFPLPVDPCITYRLSTLVRRNFYQNFKTVDGNGVVIRTLLKMAGQIPKPFDYSGQLDLYTGHSSQSETDLDVVVLDNGEFVIGESKNDVSHFFKDDCDCLRQLHKVGTQIRPDRIVLCCAQDSKNKLNEAKVVLENLFADQKVQPIIEAMPIIGPTISIFSMPRRRAEP